MATTRSNDRQRQRGEVPAWDELPETFEDFIYESFMFRDELNWKDRSFATTRITRGFKNAGTSAWRLCKRLREDTVSAKVLAGTFGVEFLLQQLRKEICPEATPDIARHMDAYLFRFSRADGESMHSYISRKKRNVWENVSGSCQTRNPP